jgi:hypothetical protein
MKLHIKDNYYTYLDDEDYQRIVDLLKHDKADPAKWQLAYNTTDAKRLYYASKTIGGRKGKKWKLHRLIMHLRGVDIDGKEIDHINGDTLDNRSCNIRLANSSQNKVNRGVRSDSISGYKCVEFQKQNKNWCAYIVYEGKKRHLGVFNTAEEAALAYNVAAIEKWGPYAKLNNIRKPKPGIL